MPGDFSLCIFGFRASRRERRNEQEILTLQFRVHGIEKKLELNMFLGVISGSLSGSILSFLANQKLAWETP